MANSFRSSGEFSDLIVEFSNAELALHKFPFLVCSEYFRALERSGSSFQSTNALGGDSEASCGQCKYNGDALSHRSRTDRAIVHTRAELTALPGGLAAFEVIADFCYGIDISRQLSQSNVVAVTCAARFLLIDDDPFYSTVREFLDRHVFSSRSAIFQLLSSACAELPAEAEQAGLVDDCVAAFVSLPDAERDRSQREEELELLQGLPCTWVAKIVKAMSEKPNQSPMVILHYIAAYLGQMNWLECVAKVSRTSQKPHSSMTDRSSASRELHVGAVNVEVQSLQFDNHPTSTDTNYAVHVLESLIGFLPLDLPLEPVFEQNQLVTMLQLLVLVKSSHAKRFSSYCAPLLPRLTTHQLEEMTPATLAQLLVAARRCQVNRWSICAATSSYLSRREAKGDLLLDEFVQLLSASGVDRERESHDGLITTIIKLYQQETALASDATNNAYHMKTEAAVRDGLALIDFSKLSHQVLQYVINQDGLPKDVLAKRAVQALQKQQQEPYAQLQNSYWSLPHPDAFLPTVLHLKAGMLPGKRFSLRAQHVLQEACFMPWTQTPEENVTVRPCAMLQFRTLSRQDENSFLLYDVTGDSMYKVRKAMKIGRTSSPLGIQKNES